MGLNTESLRFDVCTQTNNGGLGIVSRRLHQTHTEAREIPYFLDTCVNDTPLRRY